MTDGEAELIRLEAGRARLEIWPERGGSITRYWWQGESGALDWLRPNSRLSADPLAMGCFPLVPFSGRIREGRFDVAGRRIALPLNFLPERHAIHGHGWQAPWTLVQRSAHAATIEYRHRPDAWPMAYLARQTFTLGEAALELEIEVTNLADVAMPAGLGFHPYFPRTPGARVSAKVAAMWESDQAHHTPRKVVIIQRLTSPFFPTSRKGWDNFVPVSAPSLAMPESASVARFAAAT